MRAEVQGRSCEVFELCAGSTTCEGPGLRDDRPPVIRRGHGRTRRQDLLLLQPLQTMLPHNAQVWIQLALATPVVLWAGFPFFERGWMSVRNRSLNMFTLIAVGTGAAYGYSIVAAIAPGIFPASFRDVHGQFGLYFEPAAVLV